MDMAHMSTYYCYHTWMDMAPCLHVITHMDLDMAPCLHIIAHMGYGYDSMSTYLLL